MHDWTRKVIYKGICEEIKIWLKYQIVYAKIKALEVFQKFQIIIFPLHRYIILSNNSITNIIEKEF